MQYLHHCYNLFMMVAEFLYEFQNRSQGARKKLDRIENILMYIFRFLQDSLLSITFHIKDSAYVPIFTPRRYIICCLQWCFFHREKRGLLFCFDNAQFIVTLQKAYSICLLFGFHCQLSSLVIGSSLLRNQNFVLNEMFQ